jgi:hypothetical protein
VIRSNSNLSVIFTISIQRLGLNTLLFPLLLVKIEQEIEAGRQELGRDGHHVYVVDLSGLMCRPKTFIYSSFSKVAIC